MAHTGPSNYDIHIEREGGQAQVDADGWGESLLNLDIQKIKAHWRPSVFFFSCKEVGVFCTRISSLDGIKIEKLPTHVN